MDAKEAAKVLREESARIEKHGHILCSGPTAQTVKQAIDAAVAALENAEAVKNGSRFVSCGFLGNEFIDTLTGKSWKWDASEQVWVNTAPANTEHPRERALSEANNDAEADGA